MTEQLAIQTKQRPINVLLACSHKPDKDPRVTWLIDTQDEDFCFNAIGISKDVNADVIRHTPTKGVVWAMPLNENYDPKSAILKFGINPALSALASLQCLFGVDDDEYLAFFDGDNSIERLYDFRKYIHYILNHSLTLLYSCSNTKGLDLLVAVDLETLPGMLALGSILNIPVIMDAHEYWPDSTPKFSQWERNFWRNFQDLLVPHLAGVVSVSPYLTSLYAHHNTLCVPNATTWITCPPRTQPNFTQDVVFLYQGGFAQGRGLYQLINNWEGLPDNAKLHIRGPANDYRDGLINHAKKLNIFNKTVFFLDSISESELVSACANADVGIIPYEAYCKSYSHCSPNKFSQYIAAGKPVLTSKIEYINSLIDEHQIGFYVDFEEKEQFQKLINEIITRPDKILECSQNARNFFEEKYHWEKLASPFYRMLKDSAQASFKQSDDRFELNIESPHNVGLNKLRITQTDLDYMGRLDQMKITYLTLMKYTMYRTWNIFKKRFLKLKKL